jgi:hypothetical protein
MHALFQRVVYMFWLALTLEPVHHIDRPPYFICIHESSIYIYKHAWNNEQGLIISKMHYQCNIRSKVQSLVHLPANKLLAS